jgi:GNAT superfamily N-acetyltransferase
MHLSEVSSQQDIRNFHKVPHIVYKDDPDWICPLEIEIESIFNPSKNKYFAHGEAVRWVLKDKNGNLIGRVAAFINKKKAYTFEQATGGMGFFECVNDQKAADALFEVSRKWLSDRGMDAMDGPVNFGENDSWWGLHVEGSSPPGYGMHYHPSYYRRLFEDYGFYPYFEQVTNHLDITKPFPDRFWKIAEWTVGRPGLVFRHFSFKDQEKFLADFKAIYDEAWQFHDNFAPINIDDLRFKLEGNKAVIIEEFIWYAYHEEKPIGLFVMFPDVNPLLRSFSGKLHLINKIRLLWKLKRRQIKRARVVALGVVPQFQRYGIESAFFWHLERVMRKYQEYNEIEISWVGDFNPKMQSLLAATNAEFAKKHITYRKLFSPEAQARRIATIPVNTRDR